jgi:hypothetical protein
MERFMGGKFTVRPVKKYMAGYPKKGFYRKSFVAVIPIKLFSFFVIGMLFFITVPGCGEQEKLTGDAIPDYDVERTDTDATETVDDLKLDDDNVALDDDVIPDTEKNDMDELDGMPQPECYIDEDCDEGYYCDMNSNTCEMELAGEPVAECYSNEDCEDGFYCDTTTFTCEEEMLGDPVPDQMVDEDAVSDEEVPDEELGGVAPPELKS